MIFNKTIILLVLVGYEIIIAIVIIIIAIIIIVCAAHLLGYQSSHIQRALVE